VRPSKGVAAVPDDERSARLNVGVQGVAVAEAVPDTGFAMRRTQSREGRGVEGLPPISAPCVLSAGADDMRARVRAAPVDLLAVAVGPNHGRSLGGLPTCGGGELREGPRPDPIAKAWSSAWEREVPAWACRCMAAWVFMNRSWRRPALSRARIADRVG